MIKGSMAVDKLLDLIEADEFLFHVTSKDGLDGILKSGYIKALTTDGTRQFKLAKLGLKEKGTASFTTDPIGLYLEDQLGIYNDKNYVLVFEREELGKLGVRTAIYVTEEELVTQYLYDYRYAAEGAEFENEWRSVNDVNIKDALYCICKVPERIIDMENGCMRFEV